MLKGIALGFSAYAGFSWCDAIVKGVGASLPVFEIVFLGTVAQFIVILLLRPTGERWRDIFRMNHPKRVMLRAACGVISGICSTYAFTTIPLAEAYAIFFLAPAFVTLFSAFLLGERVGWRRLSAVAVGFAGVVLVVKPGFHELHLGHLAAFLVSIVGATNMIILRMIGQTERRVSLVGVMMLSAVVTNGILMVPTFQVPTPWELSHFAVLGIFGGVGQLAIMAATRLAPANRVAPTQYSQIVWAVILGAAFFAEFPDHLALVGIALIGFSGLFTLLREDKMTDWPRRTLLLRNQP